MSKKSKAQPKARLSKTSSKRTSIPSSQSPGSVNFERNGSVTYTAVPLTETEDPNAESSADEAASPSKSKSKQSKGKNKKVKKKSKPRRTTTDSDDDYVELERKPSPVLAPLPSLTKEEYEFFEMVNDGETEQVAEFLLSAAFKDMNINKLDKNGFTVLHIAISNQDVDMVSLLLKQPGIHLYDTILYAVREKNVEIAKLLLVEYDRAATEEQRQVLMNTAMTITQDPNQQVQLSKLVETSLAAVVPEVPPISTQSGVKSSIKINTSSGTVGTKSKKSKKNKNRFNYNPTSVPRLLETPADDNYEIPFDSEFSPVVTPLMLAAQLGHYSLIELFYSRNERLESEEFHHDLDCPCDICAVLEGDQDMTRIYERHHLYKALTNPDYICFMGRNEHKDPINYAFKKIEKIRKLIKLDPSYTKLYNKFEKKLETFITKMLELCRSTTEAEIFLSPKDEDEGLPHLYPRLWYVVGQDLKKVVTSPNAQNIVYKLWATDDWPEWESYTTNTRACIIACRATFWPIFGLMLLLFGKKTPWTSFRAPVNRLILSIGSYIWFLHFVHIQASYNYQRCTKADSQIPWLWPWDFHEYKHGLDDGHCTERGPPNIGTEPILVIYILSFCVNIMKRQSVSWYWRMRWNWIDFIDQLLFTATFCCWGYAYYWVEKEKKEPLKERENWGAARTMWSPDCAEIVGECFLSLAFLLAFVKLLRNVILIPECGPIQMGISHQVVDFLKGLIVMGVVIVSFGSGLMGLYMPYENLNGTDPTDNVTKPLTDHSFHTVMSTLKTLFWIQHGKAGISTTKMNTWLVATEDKNKTEKMEQVHHKYNENTGMFLFIAYHTIGALMLKNIIAGYFSQTMTQINENLEVYWKYARTEFFLTFVKDTIAPPPFNLLPPILEWTSCYKWFKYLGRKEDPKTSCSMRQCCFVTRSKKKDKWKALMKGYRDLIVQLMYRYMNSREEDKEAVKKDDLEKIGELLTEIKAFVKKTSDKIENSDEDDDDNHQFPGGGSGAVGSTSSAKTGWAIPKTMVQSRGATFLKNTVRTGGPSGVPSGNTGGENSQKKNANSESDVSQQPSESESKTGNSSGGMSTPPTTSQQAKNSATNATPKQDQDPSGFGNASTKSIKTAKENASMKNVFKPPTPPTKITKKISNESKKRDSPPKQNTTFDKSKSSYIANGVEKGSRTGGAIERNPGLEDFSGVDSVFKSVIPSPSSSHLLNNNNPSNSPITIVNNTVSTPSPKINQSNFTNKNVDPTKSYSQSKKGSRSGNGLEKDPFVNLDFGAVANQDASDYNNAKDITGKSSKSRNKSSGPSSNQSQVTPKKPTDLFTGTTPPSQVSQPVPSSHSKPMKPFLDKSIEIKPSPIALSKTSQKTMQNACEYSQPRRGSRSGGGLERPPEMGDFSGPGEIDMPYKSPSKLTNNFNSTVEIGATFVKSPLRQDSTRTPPSSKANNIKSGATNKEPFVNLDSMRVRPLSKDQPCGGVPSDYAEPRRGSRSGGGLERSPEMGDFSGPGAIEQPYKSPARSTNVFCPLTEIETTPKKSPIPQDFPRTTPTSKANNVNSGGITKEPSLKTIKNTKSVTKDQDQPCGGVSSEATTVNDYAQPRRGSRSGGGLERSPEMEDFSGPGGLDDLYKSPAKSTNNFCPLATPKKSPMRQDSTRTTPTSKANNVNSGGITKESSLKLIKNLKTISKDQDQPCGSFPSERTTVDDYAEPRRGSRSGGGLERSPEMGDFSGPGEIDEPYYKSPAESTNNFCPFAKIEVTPTKSTGTLDKNQSGWKPCSTCSIKPSATTKAGCTTCSAKPSAGTILRTKKESLHKEDEIPRQGSGKLVDVWSTTSTLGGSTRDIPGYLGASAGPMSVAKLKFEDISPKDTEIRFTAPKNTRNGDDQNSPSKSPSVIPSPVPKAPPLPLMPPSFSSDSTGDATDGSSKANDYKNPKPKSKQRPL